MIPLDAADIRILSMLQRNGRLSNVELAEAVGLSPSPCLRRVKSLEEAGIISGYTVQLNQKKLGLGITAYVQVHMQRHNDSLTDSFKAAIKNEECVLSCYLMAGSCDFLMKVVAKDLDAYADFALKRLLKIEGVRDITSSFVLEMVKSPEILPLLER